MKNRFIFAWMGNVGFWGEETAGSNELPVDRLCHVGALWSYQQKEEDGSQRCQGGAEAESGEG